MTERRSRGGLWLTLCMVGGILAAATAHLISVFPYEWAEDQRLAAQTSADAVLVVTVLSILGLAAVVGAFVLATRMLRQGRRTLGTAGFCVAIVVLLACLQRLTELLPLYQG